MIGVVFFFLYKQTSAYEMRISDWSSDVCSSDLLFDTIAVGGDIDIALAPEALGAEQDQFSAARMQPRFEQADRALRPRREKHDDDVGRFERRQFPFDLAAELGLLRDRPPLRIPRSEEHTSELQSLMRISYAVFCLKKKTTQ